MPDGSATAHLYRPKLVTLVAEGYSFEAFRSDLTAALTVAVVALPLSMAIAVASGVEPVRGLYTSIIGGFLVSLFTLRLDPVLFWTRAIDILDFSDLMQGLTKPLVYGFILATVGCYQGLNVKGGTQGVGRATTHAVVAASVFILITDFFLTKLMLYLAGHVF